MEYAGKDVGQIMGDENHHVHSRNAYDMMEDYKVGELGGDEKIVSEGE
jgi:4-hydroxysphinganine ceramide fatty acyl 2-hydroxylase